MKNEQIQEILIEPKEVLRDSSDLCHSELVEV